ncbi:MAG: AbiV family abortive infection protein [Chryseobacterium sp.]|nr:MAG: AbiV family abortive infection protein [Chryseobacterium sp.]
MNLSLCPGAVPIHCVSAEIRFFTGIVMALTSRGHLNRTSNNWPTIYNFTNNFRPSKMTKNIQKKGWTSLSQVQYKETFVVAGKNAERHFACSEILSSAGQHQNAIAHLILGSEELVKSFWCLLMGRNVDLKRLPWFTKLFYNHKIRHDLLKDFFSVYLLFFNSSLPKRKRSDGFFKTIGVFIGRSLTAYGNYRWWENADLLKQRAFYVDFADGIIDPALISASDYISALNYVTLFRNDFKQMVAKIESLSDSQLQNLIDELQLYEIDRLRQETYKATKEIKKISGNSEGN